MRLLPKKGEFDYVRKSLGVAHSGSIRARISAP